jgi:hypothetical protein
MIVGKVWKLTNVSHYENLTTFCFSGNFFSSPEETARTTQ